MADEHDGASTPCDLAHQAEAALLEFGVADRQHLIDQQVADPERLQALRTSGLLDPLPDEAFDRLTRLAALAVSAPIAAFTLVDADRDVYKAAHGLPPPLDTGRELRGRTFCQHVVSGAQALVLEDTRQWPGYRDVPTVQSLGVRAYLGVPITDAAGLCLGALCALDIRPHSWTDRDIEMMEELARSLARELGPDVRVNGVAPGTILWPDDDSWSDELSRQRIVNQTALKRTGEPDDIAKAVEFLVAAAPYVTGQVIAVDGGRSITL